jgi:hypothetical protein
MKTIHHWAILIGTLVCAAQTAQAQQPQQQPAVPTPTMMGGTAMAVEPLHSGQSADGITTGGAVFYCVHLPAAEPDKNPAGGINCTGGRIPALPAPAPPTGNR